MLEIGWFVTLVEVLKTPLPWKEELCSEQQALDDVKTSKDTGHKAGMYGGGPHLDTQPASGRGTRIASSGTAGLYSLCLKQKKAGYVGTCLQ